MALNIDDLIIENGFSANTITATTIFLGVNNINNVFAPQVSGGYLPISGGTVTGGTNFSTSLSAATLISGSTNLYSIFATVGSSGTQTAIQNGLNTYTGGTADLPTVNVSALTINTLVASGSSQFGIATATSFSATSISATTFYGSASNLTGMSGSFGITIDGSNSVITTGNKGYAIMPYNAIIVGWDIVGNTSGVCIVDVWKNTSIPTSANTITGNEIPTLSSQQINSNNIVNSWNKNISTNDVIAFNVLSASTISRVNLIIKVIKI